MSSCDKCTELENKLACAERSMFVLQAELVQDFAKLAQSRVVELHEALRRLEKEQRSLIAIRHRHLWSHHNGEHDHG